MAQASAASRVLKGGSWVGALFLNVPAVGPAADPKTVWIGYLFRNQIINAGHDVFEVSASPVCMIAFDEFFAVANRAANVGIEHGVTMRGEKLAPAFA